MMNTATETQKNGRSNRAIWIIVISMVVAVYALSFGPAFYVALKIVNGGTEQYRRSIIPVFVTLYLPHLYLMANSDLYYDYTCMWAHWAVSSQPDQSRQEFHDTLYRNGPYGL